jgi:cytochrome P450
MAAESDAPADGTVAFLNIVDPAFDPDGPAVHAAREAGWYARSPLGYAVLRYAEVATLLRDRRLRQGGVESLAAQEVTEGLLADWMRAAILNQEGEPHARLRLVSQAFTPRAVDRLRPTMRAMAHDLLDGFAVSGACEFMAAVADPYPSRVIAALLGIPEARQPEFHGWASDLGLLFGYTVAQDRARIEAALEGLAACVDDLTTARRAAPGPDLLSALIAAEEAGDQLSDAELRVLVTALVFAGQDATRNQLGCALTLFLEHPHQWARLAAEPALAPRAVEEVMRVRPTVPSIWRVATETSEFQGLGIPAGTFLSLVVATANTDPRVFGSGGFDITRERPAQLTFGGGVHACLGAALAAGHGYPRPAGPAAPLPPGNLSAAAVARRP